jgi:hypothetical protein
MDYEEPICSGLSLDVGTQTVNGRDDLGESRQFALAALFNQVGVVEMHYDSGQFVLVLGDLA